MTNLFFKISSVPNWITILEQSGFSQTREIEDMADRWLEITAQAKKDYYTDRTRVRKIETELVERFEKKYKELVKKWRVSYLESEIKELETQLLKIEQDYQKSVERAEPYWFRRVVYNLCKSDKIRKKIKGLTFRLRWAKYSGQISRDRIAPDMIVRAREYPIRDLVDVNSAGFCICPFHNDKSPSMYTKNNFFFCYSCNWSGDTIKFLMERDNLSFVEAVKRLQ